MVSFDTKIKHIILLGWAYDLRTVSQEIIDKRSSRTGDGSRATKDGGELDINGNSHQQHHHQQDEGEVIWGWDDPDMIDLHRRSVVVLS